LLSITPKLSLFGSLTIKLILYVRLLFTIFALIFLVSPFQLKSQENNKSEIQSRIEVDSRLEMELDQILEEDPLTETDSDLGLVEDPQKVIKSESDLNEDRLESNITESILEKGKVDEYKNGNVIQEDSPESTDAIKDIDKDLEEKSESEGLVQEDKEKIIENDLGLEADPFEENESKPAIPENQLESGESNLGLESDPFGNDEVDLDLDEDPLSEESLELELNGSSNKSNDNEDHVDEEQFSEEEFIPNVSFSHEVKTMLGGSETKGLSVLDPLLTEIKELRLVTTYDQSVKVQTSPQMYNYFRLSVSFSQNYEIQKKRIFDGFATVREIYSNYRIGSHQIRYGTQIFDLGKVDLDNVIDVLHMNNIMGIYTFDPDDSKDAIPSIRYNWFHGGHTATFYLSPVRQQTFGMRFTEFREEVEKKEQGNEDSKVSFLRDYYGLQYQWTGDIMDTRLGMFHWFDSNPYIKLEYQKVEDNGTTLQGSFEDMLSNYNEKETRSDFLTLEIDATWTDMVWKFESGYFKKRNLYSYEIPDGKVIRLSTFSAPHFAFSTSFERTFPYFYWLMLFSHRKWYDVPSNTHVFLFENESGLVTKKRNLFRNQASGVAVLKTPDNSLRITLLSYQTWPFKQKGFASLFTWERFKENMELELKFFRLETEKQKMLQDKIKTNQVYLTYTQKFKAN
tara:strand:- start:2486 stop:4528 length:2043 start_codon:yes stop_codon:yes gene_type:complete